MTKTTTYYDTQERARRGPADPEVFLGRPDVLGKAKLAINALPAFDPTASETKQQINAQALEALKRMATPYNGANAAGDSLPGQQLQTYDVIATDSATAKFAPSTGETADVTSLANMPNADLEIKARAAMAEALGKS